MTVSQSETNHFGRMNRYNWIVIRNVSDETVDWGQHSLWILANDYYDVRLCSSIACVFFSRNF